MGRKVLETGLDKGQPQPAASHVGPGPLAPTDGSPPRPPTQQLAQEEHCLPSRAATVCRKQMPSSSVPQGSGYFLEFRLPVGCLNRRRGCRLTRPLLSIVMAAGAPSGTPGTLPVPPSPCVLASARGGGTKATLGYFRQIAFALTELSVFQAGAEANVCCSDFSRELPAAGFICGRDETKWTERR